MKVVGKHAKNCYAVKEVNLGTWSNAWCQASPETRFGSKSTPFAHYGEVVWLLFKCNCTWCDAKLAIPDYEFMMGWVKK